MRRRWALAQGAGALAALAGGVAVYRWRAEPRASAEAPAGSAEDTSLWQLAFDTPQGARLALASLRARPLVLNFWATWCPPCVREMPALDRFHREHAARGWQVLGIAADNATAVREFLARTPVGFAIALAGFEGVALSRQLGNPTGGLPFTVVFGSGGRLAHRHVGETSFDQLTGWAKDIS
jgi:thiol-disulfide isomerase/thioredoxin